jgi:hypothetical protein
MSGKPIPRSETEYERRELENFRDRLQHENGLVRKLQGILSEMKMRRAGFSRRRARIIEKMLTNVGWPRRRSGIWRKNAQKLRRG